MTILKENNLKLDWLLGVIGIKNNWLSKETFFLDLEDLKGEEDFYTQLYLKDNLTNEELIEMILEKFQFSISQLQLGERVWQLLFLKNIKESDLNLNQKLNEIASLWPAFNYTKDWENFINYMPLKNESGIGEENLYNNFLDFYNKNNSEVRKLGYTIS
ncbi:DUF2247 family protein [Chryseobacterium gossypii]|uniref:DUF2247 family protein n=1 Tax=Chryseobacterium gossypii TaxID=3231602 RepID=UPI0035239EDB